MIKTILVPVIGDRSDERAFSTAAMAARLFGAHLEFLFVHPDPMAILAAVSGGDFGTGLAAPDLLEDLQKEDRARAAQARRSFESFCARERIDIVDAPPGPERVSAAWREERGDESAVVLQRARYNDLVVIAPAGEEEGPAPQTVEGALMGSGRPILLASPVPPASIARTVVIAWKDTSEAARAVMASMPFLKQADKVIVLTVGETEEQNLASVEGLAEQLRWHRFEVEAQCLAPGHAPAARQLVDAARDAKADLIVMGAYGHSRVRQMIFGGFTRHMLQGAELPVLLVH